MRNEGFRRVILREAERRRIGGKKKYVGAVSERRHLGKKKKKKKKKRSWTISFKAERVRTGHGSQNRTVGPRSGRFHAFFAWNCSLP